MVSPLTPGPYLKTRTASAHEATENLLLGDALLQHTVTAQQYEKLILVTHRVWGSAWKPLTLRSEPAELWKEVTTLTKLVGQDAKHLGLPLDIPVEGFPELQDIVDELGVYYVLLGSTMGGRVIARHLQKCPELSHFEPSRFYAGCAAMPRGIWKRFKELLSEHVRTQQEMQRCGDVAERVFSLYGEWY